MTVISTFLLRQKGRHPCKGWRPLSREDLGVVSSFESSSDYEFDGISVSSIYIRGDTKWPAYGKVQCSKDIPIKTYMLEIPHVIKIIVMAVRYHSS